MALDCVRGIDVHFEFRVFEGWTVALFRFAFGMAMTFSGAFRGRSSSFTLHAYNLKINLLEVKEEIKVKISQKLIQNQIRIFL